MQLATSCSPVDESGQSPLDRESTETKANLIPEAFVSKTRKLKVDFLSKFTAKWKLKQATPNNTTRSTATMKRFHNNQAPKKEQNWKIGARAYRRLANELRPAVKRD